MRILLTICLLFLFLSLAGQSLEIVLPDKSLQTNINTNISTEIHIRNLSQELIMVMVELPVQESTPSYSAYLTHTQNSKSATQRVQLQLSPNGSDHIKLHFNAGINAAQGQLAINVFNLSDPVDAVLEYLDYDISETRSDKLLFHKNKIIVSNFYPNPTSEKATIDYHIDHKLKEPKVILQNLLGSVVGEYPLDPQDGKLQIDTKNLTPGIYFYTLYFNDEGIITKKLVVRR